MADILGIAGALIWIATGLYAFYSVRRFNKRRDRILQKLAQGMFSDDS